MSTVRSTCGYCSTGCNLTVQMSDGLPTKVTASPEYPVNGGKACPKGFQFLGHLGAPERALTPFLREAAGRLQAVTWDEALQVFTQRFKALQDRYGPESVALLSTGQITSEEFAYLGALAKFGMGIVHGDGNTRQCMATAVTAHRQSFGYDAPPFTYRDFEESDLLVFLGANPVVAHPIMWQRVKKNPREARIVVVDPRRTETASAPGVEHLTLRPKSDLVLLYGLARELISRDWFAHEYVAEHTSGFEEFRAFIASFDLERVSAATGLAPDRIVALAEAIHGAERTSFWWTMGVNQGHQAVRTAQAIIDLALLTGNIGRPGTGANSITGQCNAMGARQFSIAASLFCGRDFANAEHRAEVASILGIEEGLIPQQPSLAYDQILAAVDEGRIKGLWIVCTNPVSSWPDHHALARTLRKAEFVVVQDMFYDTATAEAAHLILPAAGCGEKEGTFINSERRIGVVRRVADPPGEALPDLRIFQRVAEAWGCSPLLREWTSPEAVFGIMKRLSRGTPCDFAGITDYETIEQSGGIQWPFPEGSAAVAPADPVGPERQVDRLGREEGPGEDATATRSERRLFEDGRFFTPDGRARFVFEEPVAPPEQPDEHYPFVLLTGRGSVTQWHTLTRTDRAPVLKRASPDPAYVEISPVDAQALALADGDRVTVRSRRGRATVRIKVSEGIVPGQLFMPMHHAETNRLTPAVFDPYSRQPAYKYTAVSLAPGSGAQGLE